MEITYRFNYLNSTSALFLDLLTCINGGGGGGGYKFKPLKVVTHFDHHHRAIGPW